MTIALIFTFLSFARPLRVLTATCISRKRGKWRRLNLKFAIFLLQRENGTLRGSLFAVEIAIFFATAISPFPSMFTYKSAEPFDS